MSLRLDGIDKSRVIDARNDDQRLVVLDLSDDSVSSSRWMLQLPSKFLSYRDYDNVVSLNLDDDELIPLFRFGSDGAAYMTKLSATDLHEQYYAAKAIDAASHDMESLYNGYATTYGLAFGRHQSAYYRGTSSSLCRIVGKSLYDDNLVEVELPCVILDRDSLLDGLDVYVHGVSLDDDSKDRAVFVDNNGDAYRLYMIPCINKHGNVCFEFAFSGCDDSFDAENAIHIYTGGYNDPHPDGWKNDILDFAETLENYLSSPISALSKKFDGSIRKLEIPLCTNTHEIVVASTYVLDFKTDDLFLRFDSVLPETSLFYGVVFPDSETNDSFCRMSTIDALNLNRKAISYLSRDLQDRDGFQHLGSDRFIASPVSASIADPTFELPFDISNSGVGHDLVEQLKKYQEIEHAYAELDESKKANIDEDYTEALAARSVDESDVDFGTYRDIAKAIAKGDVPEAAPVDDSWKDFAAQLGAPVSQDDTNMESSVVYLNGIKNSQISWNREESTWVADVALADNAFWSIPLDESQIYDNPYLSHRSNFGIEADATITIWPSHSSSKSSSARTLTGAELKAEYDAARRDYFLSKSADENQDSGYLKLDFRFDTSNNSKSSADNQRDSGDIGE